MAKKAKRITKKPRRGIVKVVEIFDRLGNDDDPYYFHGIGHNGEIVFPSEGYDKADDRNDTARKIAKQLGVWVRVGKE